MNNLLHPATIAPGDEDTRLVQCPDCGQLETWSEDELSDHGKCRANTSPCPVCNEERTS